VSVAFALAALVFAAQIWSAERTVAVSGYGEMQAEPDRAVVVLGIESREPQLQTARDNVTRGVEAIQKLARDLKIDSKYVRATRIHVQPEYDWSGATRERRFIGYFVQRQVEIDLRDLDKLGQLLERAITAGANQVNDPQLDSTKRREFERQALAKALEDARANAETLARTAGMELGVVQSISTSQAVTPRPMPMQRVQLMAAEAQAAETYQAGLLTFSATVQAAYDLRERARP
jgi:uncharacterized protein